MQETLAAHPDNRPAELAHILVEPQDDVDAVVPGALARVRGPWNGFMEAPPKGPPDAEALELQARIAKDILAQLNADRPPRTSRRTTRSSQRTVSRCRARQRRRTRPAATKKTAATSTGDPDPEPPGDRRARPRRIALTIAARVVGGGL